MLVDIKPEDLARLRSLGWDTKHVGDTNAPSFPTDPGEAAEMLRAYLPEASARLRGLLLGAFAEIASLRKELASTRTMVFHGPHDPAKTYPEGAVVQRSSATWVALCATAETPGQSGHWRRIAGGKE